MSATIYSEDDDDNRQSNPVSDPRKPLNPPSTLGTTPQTSHLKSSPASKPNVMASVVRPSARGSDIQTVTIPRAKLRQLIDALSSSVQLLQESVGSIRPQSVLETDFDDDMYGDGDSDAVDECNTKYLNVKVSPRWKIKHNHETLAAVFNQGQMSFCLEFSSCTDDGRVWSLVL